jgi:hypothetical protein
MNGVSETRRGNQEDEQSFFLSSDNLNELESFIQRANFSMLINVLVLLLLLLIAVEER